MDHALIPDSMIEQLPNRGGLGRLHGQPHDGTYLQNWNPLVLASELTPGKIVGKDFLGTRVIVYRAPDGTPVVQSAYCPHLGADLSHASIIDGEVRCPYHFWKFSPADGHCTQIPGAAEVTNGARIYNYPAAERWGIIWAFSGETPLYGLPEFPNTREDEMTYLSARHGFRKIDGYISSSNLFDFQHLEWVHGIKDAKPESEVYEPCVVTQRQHSAERTLDAKLYGCNWITFHLQFKTGMETFFMAGSAQVAPGISEAFYIAAMRKTLAAELGEQGAQEKMANQIKYIHKLYAEDEPILLSIRFRGRHGKMVQADSHLAQFLRYVEKYPRFQPYDV